MNSWVIADSGLFIAVMRKQVHRNSLTPAEGIAKAQLILDYPIDYFIDGDLLRKAYEIAGIL